jgi:hypothetical protein
MFVAAHANLGHVRIKGFAHPVVAPIKPVASIIDSCMSLVISRIWTCLGVLLLGWNLFWTFLIAMREFGVISAYLPYWIIQIMLIFSTTILLGIIIGLCIAEQLEPAVCDRRQSLLQSPSVHTNAMYPPAPKSKYGTMNDPEAL